jgi:hypothetical protein
VLAASILIILMMEAASTSETSVNFYQTTWYSNPEDNHLHDNEPSDIAGFVGRVNEMILVGKE